MARPPIERAVGGVPRVTLFKPAGVPGRELEQLQLAVDELEAIRLVDLEGLSHEQAAEVMGVSRQTVGRVLERGRAKVAEALVAGKAILIGGGQYRVEPRQLCCFAAALCGRWIDITPEPVARPVARPRAHLLGPGRTLRHGGLADAAAAGHGRGERRPERPARARLRIAAVATGAAAALAARDLTTPNESEIAMTDETTTRVRVAIPSEPPGGLEARRSGHFGRCECFTLVDVSDGEVGDMHVLTNAPHTEGGCMAPVCAGRAHGRRHRRRRHRRPAAHGLQPGRHRRARRPWARTCRPRCTPTSPGGLPVVGLEGACQH